MWLSLWAFAIAVLSSLSCSCCVLRGWLLLVNSGLIFNVSSSEKLSMAPPSKAAIQPLSLSLTLPILILVSSTYHLIFFFFVCVWSASFSRENQCRVECRVNTQTENQRLEHLPRLCHQQMAELGFELQPV